MMLPHRFVGPALVALALAAVIGLSACSAIPGYSAFEVGVVGLTTKTVEDRRQANDLQAETTAAVACDISIGAYARMVEGNVKRGFGLICGLDDGAAVASDLKAAAEIFAAIKEMQAP